MEPGDNIKDSANSGCSTATCEAGHPSKNKKNRRGQRRTASDVAACKALPQQAPDSLLTASCASGKTEIASQAKPIVNSTSVRRRAKPTNTITRVVTSVSLETLRAKRNGTNPEDTDSGDKTVQEVSRILLMYSSWQQQHQQGIKGISSRQHMLVPNVANVATTYGGGYNVDPMEDSLPKVTVGFVGDQQSHGFQQRQFNLGDFGTSDAREHVALLIRAGKLPPDSLEVLEAMLRHSPQGGRSEVQCSTKRTKSSLQKVFHGSKVNDAQQESRDVISQELRSMGAAFSGYPQPPFFAGLPEAVFSICGYYPIYTGKGCHDVGNSSVADTLTANGNYSAPKGVDLPPAPGRYSRRQLYVNGLDENATTGRGVSVPAPENNVENTRDKPKEGMTDNDDDDDVIKMLYDIREAAHIELTPHKVSAETFYRGSVITSSPYSELVSNTVVSDNSVSNDSLPAPSVTISQSEREALRSLQQVFLAHMRHSGSPDRTPPEVPSSGSVWRSFVGNERLSDSQGWIGEQNARDEGDRFWHSTNRTLFSYQTDPHERNAHKAMTKSTEWNMSVEPGEVLVHSPYRRRGSEASLTDEQLSLSLPKARTNNLLDEEKPISHPASREDGCTFHPLGKSVTASRIPLASLSVNEGVEASETCCRWSSSTVPGFLPVAKGLHMTNARGLWPSNTRLTANYRDGPDSQRGGKYYTNGSEKCEVQHAAA